MSARQQILELRQLHLQLGLVAAGAGGEDVENDLGPVHDRRESSAPGDTLHRESLLVEDHQRSTPVLDRARNSHLAASDQRTRMGEGTCWVSHHVSPRISAGEPAHPDAR